MVNCCISSLFVSNLGHHMGLASLTRLPKAVCLGHLPVDLYPRRRRRPAPNRQVPQHFWISLV
jgi:hypothetical protein